jgi:hypothetical protein
MAAPSLFSCLAGFTIKVRLVNKVKQTIHDANSDEGTAHPAQDRNLSHLAVACPFRPASPPGMKLKIDYGWRPRQQFFQFCFRNLFGVGLCLEVASHLFGIWWFLSTYC